MTAAPDTDRLHALDALRGLALTLGVFFHAAMSYLPGWDMWIVNDPQNSQTLGVVWFVLHIFRMSLFFLLAGFFGRLLFHRRGLVGFARDRGRRIALPFAIFWPLCLASIIALVVWAWYATHPGETPPPPPRPPQEFGAFPLTHLWFLYVLMWLYVLAVAGRQVIAAIDRDGRGREGVDRAVGALTTHWILPFVLVLPFLASMRFVGERWFPYFGIPTADSNLIVNPQALAAYGTAFVFGWLLHRRQDLLKIFARRWFGHLALAITLTATCLWLLGDTPITEPAAPGPKTTAFIVAYALAIWNWSLGLIGVAMRLWSKASAARRYLADASYWIYIAHLPVVVALQVVFATVAWPWFVEYPLIVGVAFPILLASYHGLVRYSWLGAILNGRRASRPAKSPKPALQGA